MREGSRTRYVCNMGCLPPPPTSLAASQKVLQPKPIVTAFGKFVAKPIVTDKVPTESRPTPKLKGGLTWPWIAGEKRIDWGNPRDILSAGIEKHPQEDAFQLPPRTVEIAGETLQQAKKDPVHRPAHYARYAIEPVYFIMKNKLPFAIGNILKYVLRYDAKDGLQDLKKARRYLDMLIKQTEGDERFAE